MAIELQGFKFTAIAGESLAAKQYHFMKLSADMTVIGCAALTDIPCGVLQNNPVSGLAAEIMVYGITKVVAGAGAIAATNLIGTDADGHAVVVDPDGAADNYYCGQVCLGAGANEIASALIDCASPVIQSGS